MRAGRVATQPPVMVNVPSVLDDTMRVDGTDHILSLEVLYTPYAIPGGWTGSTEPRRWLDQVSTMLAPGFTESLVDWRAMTPDRYERDFYMPRGYATSFAGTPITALRGRDPELTRYQTPVHGLYLTGAATFPGAGIWGASGRNAALRILAQRG